LIDKRRRAIPLKEQELYAELSTLWFDAFDKKYSRVPGLFTNVRFRAIKYHNSGIDKDKNLITIIRKRYAVVLAIPGYDELVLGYIIKYVKTNKVLFDTNGIACAVLNNKGIEMDGTQCTYICNKVIHIFTVGSIIYDDTEASLLLKGTSVLDSVKLSMTSHAILTSLVLEYLKNIIK
jgi:hypothetical protein